MIRRDIMTNTEQKIGDVFKLGYADRMQEYDIYERMFKAVIETIDDVPRYKVHKSPIGYEVHKDEEPKR